MSWWIPSRAAQFFDVDVFHLRLVAQELEVAGWVLAEALVVVVGTVTVVITHQGVGHVSQATGAVEGGWQWQERGATG